MEIGKNKFKNPKENAVIATGIFLFLCLIIHAPANAAIKDAVFSGGNLKLEATNASVSEILEAIARKGGIDIFVARGCQFGGDRKSINITGEPVEDVLRSILRGYNYAVIYIKENDDFRISTLKIYPEGQQDKDVVPLFSSNRLPVSEEKGRRGETVTVTVSAAGEIISNGQLGRKGLLVPSQLSVSESDMEQAESIHTPWFSLQTQLESQEAAKYQEIMLLQKKLEAANDPALKQALAATYTDEMAKYHATKKANLNKIEALKRITLFKNMTGK
jgi:hypothetical protein